ncbi:MAG: TetR/AcrR family transcriptional regulator [Vallitaleaceae bacterium]|nr:TetR/AcrR family transcriptional regulator [Vallitaleaceae bacterium]
MNEINKQKEKRKEDILAAAIEVFKEKSIRSAKMTDIALKSEVGVATVYRYFKTKLDLVIEAVNWMCKEEMQLMLVPFEDDGYKSMNGFEQVSFILKLFILLYEVYPDFVALLEQFDNYVVEEQIGLEQLENYEKNIIDLKEITFGAMERGKKDGSIKMDIDNNIFYTTITHSLMSLSQKLILRGNILKSDSEVNGKKQLALLIELAEGYIKN